MARSSCTARRPRNSSACGVNPTSRGLGVGRRLLERLEALARDNNVMVLHLETNRALTEAIKLYRSAGFVEVPPFNDEPYTHHWFEKRLT